MDSASLGTPAAVWADINDLLPWADNPKHNDAAAVERVRASIEKFGFGAPVLARKANGEIIAGHTRVLAAKVLGMPTVPVRYLDIDEDAAHMLALADNQLAKLGEWDDAKLAAFLASVQGDPMLPITGFDEALVNKLLADAAEDDETVADESGVRRKSTGEKLDGFLNSAFRQIVLIFDQADYDRIVAQLDALRAKWGAELSNTEVVARLLAEASGA